MAKRYIDLDRTLKNLPDDLSYKASVKRVLMQAPEADVAEVRHGKWTENKTEYFLYGCSLCGYRVNYEHNFCPECGARMDGD